jgi:hypothetical protein
MAQKQNGPGDLIDHRTRCKKIPPSRYSPTQEMCSTIAETGLNFRVRNGNGCGPCSKDSGKNNIFKSVQWFWTVLASEYFSESSAEMFREIERKAKE